METSIVAEPVKSTCELVVGLPQLRRKLLVPQAEPYTMVQAKGITTSVIHNFNNCLVSATGWDIERVAYSRLKDTQTARPLILFGSSHLANLLGLSQPSIPLLNDLRSSDLFQICFLEGNMQMRERYKKVYMRERSRNKSSSHKLPSTSLTGLYSAYAISCIGDRLWTFALILILEYIGGIRLVCFSQLFDEIIIMAFGSVIGSWMDHHTRKRGIITVLIVNNTNVAISAALLASCITISEISTNYDSHSLLWHILYVICIVLSIITCSLSCLASEMEKMAFTKDWIVVITKKDETSLSAANAWMKTIDLSSSVVSPFISGYIINSIGYRFACMIFVVWNLLSVFIEAYIIIRVYNAVAELAKRDLSPCLDLQKQRTNQPERESDVKSDVLPNVKSDVLPLHQET
ncbi:unnamed protein product [Brugia pahangi]|uniref:Solute carrier family 40 member n=1 Tax=Brugia pahangi TaxID=6280 RepID=A0A0N4T2Y2_BRUPA|nr:unnamed protein product [Brugia pahangi]